MGMGMLPMFGMPPLNPYGGMHSAAAAAAAANAFRPMGGAMQKVASMPAMHPGMMSPPADRDHKRKAESPIPEAAEEGASGSPRKRHAVEGADGAVAAVLDVAVAEEGGRPVANGHHDAAVAPVAEGDSDVEAKDGALAGEGALDGLGNGTLPDAVAEAAV